VLERREAVDEPETRVPARGRQRSGDTIGHRHSVWSA
jgi:hypothetical protein